MAQQTIELQARLDAVNEKNNSVILSAFKEVHRRFATFCGHSEPLHFNTLLCLRNDLACHVYKEYASVHPLRIEYGDFVRHALHAFNLMDGHISILALQGNPSDGSHQEQQFMSFVSESLSNWCPTHQTDNIDCIAHHCFVSKLNTDTVG